MLGKEWPPGQRITDWKTLMPKRLQERYFKASGPSSDNSTHLRESSVDLGSSWVVEIWISWWMTKVKRYKIKRS